MHLYLITHALTHQERTLASARWRLSPQGEQQAQILATQPFWATVDQVVVSSEPKTHLTVEPLLAQRPLPLLVDARFDELHRPGWTEDYAAQVRRAFTQPAQPAGEWEAAAAALARFLTGMAHLCATFPDQTLALVGHGLTLSLYRAHLLGQSQVDFAAWQQLSFCAVAWVDPPGRRLLADFQPVAGVSPRG